MAFLARSALILSSVTRLVLAYSSIASSRLISSSSRFNSSSRNFASAAIWSRLACACTYTVSRSVSSRTFCIAVCASICAICTSFWATICTFCKSASARIFAASICGATGGGCCAIAAFFSSSIWNRLGSRRCDLSISESHFSGSRPKAGLATSDPICMICWFCMSRSTKAVDPRASIWKSPLAASFSPWTISHS